MSSGFCSQSMWAFSHLKQHNPQLSMDKENCAGSAGANSFLPLYWSKDQLLVPAWVEEITPIKWGTDGQSCSEEPTPLATDPNTQAGQQHLITSHRAAQNRRDLPARDACHLRVLLWAEPSTPTMHIQGWQCLFCLVQYNYQKLKAHGQNRLQNSQTQSFYPAVEALWV